MKSEDSSSQNAYGLRESSFEENLITDYNYLRDLAFSIVGDRKEPRDAFELTMANEFPQVLSYEVGDALTVVNAHTGANSLWSIRRMQHDVVLARGLEHTARYSLGRAAPRPWLVLDHAEFGVLDGTRQLAL